MSQTARKSADTIPQQDPISWAIALSVSWAGLRRRFLRSLITMAGVILAIAFLAYMLITDRTTKALIDAYYATGNAELNTLLQKAGIDVFGAGGTDRMMLLLIGLSLLICLVGIVNAMLMAVTERVKEIGTLKCLGALDSFIVKTYFLESSLQGIMGTLIGMGLGSLVSGGIAWYNFKRFAFLHFPVMGALQALAVTLLIGTLISVIAAVGPAYLAARKRPVEAMRVEE